MKTRDCLASPMASAAYLRAMAARLRNGGLHAPLGALGVLASLQNIESAAAAGDNYPVRPSLVINGLGTIAAACFGSPFPSSIYIGHPAWKKLGARAGYSVLNGVGITLVCLTGAMAALTWLIPAEAGIAPLGRGAEGEVAPGPEALAVAQDRIAEKQFLNASGAPTRSVTT